MTTKIDGLHGKPNSTRLIVYRNYYNEHGYLVWMEAVEEITEDRKQHGVFLKDGEEE